MHCIWALALKPPASVLDLWVPFKNQAVSGNRNKKQKTEAGMQNCKVPAAEVCNVQRRSMNAWQVGISVSIIDPGIQVGTGPVPKELENAELRCSQERWLENSGLHMTFNICIDIKKIKVFLLASFLLLLFFNNYFRLFLHYKSLGKELTRNISEWHLIAPVKTMLIKSCQGS